MLRLIYSILRVLPLVALVAATVTGSAQAAVVTLDCSTTKAVSDSDEVTVAGVRATGEQIGIYIKNTTYKPVSVKLVANGLAGDRYSVRVDDADSVKTRKQLAQGVEFEIPGYTPDVTKLRCLQLTKPRAQAEADRLAIYKVGDPKRAWNTLNQAADWANSGVRNTEDSMAAQVFIWPADAEPRGIPNRNRMASPDIARALDRACKLLQLARARMHNALRDEALRNSTLLAMTPVEFVADYTTTSGRPHVAAKVINNTNLPISGTITYHLPKWKTTAKSLAFKDLAPGATRQFDFDLVPPAKGAQAPSDLPIAANLSIHQVIDPQEFRSGTTAPFATAIVPTDYSAKLKLKVVLDKNGGPVSK